MVQLSPADVSELEAALGAHQVLHDRTEYEDWPEPERKRHLLRLWLSPPDAGRCRRPSPTATAE